MSLNGIMGAATAGLQVSQLQLRAISDNISNVNTPGYARKTVDQSSQNLGGGIGTVSASAIRRVVDSFLAQASLTANANAGAAGAASDLTDRAQALFGDPGSGTGYFNQLDNVFSAFGSAAQDPASNITRNQALASIGDFLSQSNSVYAQVQRLSTEAQSRITADVSQVNGLLAQIDALNKEIVRQTIAGGDVTDAQNAQQQAINSLSSLIDVSIAQRSEGGVDIRSGGALLLSRGGAATLSQSNTGQILAAAPGATPKGLTLTSGELKGLVDMRDVELPAMSSQLGEYVTRAVDEINRAHNAAAAVPPPNTLTGRDTGLDLPTAIGGFTGTTSVVVLDSSNAVTTQVDIDFTAGTINGSGFTAASFLTDLNTALGGAATASFSGGALSITAASASAGVAIQDDATTPSTKAGRGFSQFFGLNDLISSAGMPYTATGLTASDPHGFTAGGVITMRLTDASGATVRDAAVSIPAGAQMSDLLTALNDTVTGVGLYGAFSLDSDGRLAFTSGATAVKLGVISDTTQRGVGGPSISKLFGVDPKQAAGRANTFQIRSDIAADSSKLALARLDLTVAPGQPALAKGDSRGAQLLAAVGEAATRFDAAGWTGSQTLTLTNYAAQMSGQIAQKAVAYDTHKTGAQAVANEATARQASAEGVNLDEEMIKLTTYQQSYNAAARLVQAVADLYTTLLSIK
jgi:flagellar hook-associated protein 1 FlgK